MSLILILLLALLSTAVTGFLAASAPLVRLTPYALESDAFRAMKLGTAVLELDRLNPEQLAALMIRHNYDLTECTDLSYDNKIFKMKKPREYRTLAEGYERILSDLVYFPIPASIRPDTPRPIYENGWQQKRTYGGERGHEGCDIMGAERERGFYPVVSMSSGTVEKVGWLEQGGWRIGIRSPSGAYLYYAHLYSYSRDWKAGDTVKAGELLGFMGDSGYGKKENTIGNFPVHLHLGIYIQTEHFEELSVNPYWILKYLEKRTLLYDY